MAQIKMLDYAHQRAIEVLKTTRVAVLATTGPAGVRASEFLCEAVGLDLYLLVPQTSDHLFNLEQQSTVALLANEWELQGQAKMIPQDAPHPELSLLSQPGAEWHALIQVHPTRLQIRRQEGWGNSETLDVDQTTHVGTPD